MHEARHADWREIPAKSGAVRAGAPLKFPRETLAIGKLVPDFDKYRGPAPDFGRMETTLSDPSVQQQFGMIVGIPNARQVNTLETLNLRGERSVTCKKGCDAASGDLPSHCPKACDAFRKQPDALERAAELDAQYGSNPDTAAMPLYCVPMSFKAVYGAKDMRSTGGGARETWGGTTCNPYDTERETGGSSGGSGASVAANLVVCSICETTGGSCRNPANFNGTVNLVPTKGMISYGGGIGANPYQDRPGILCRTVKDAVTVLDAFRDSKTGSYFDARDPYTALSRGIASAKPYASALVASGAAKPCAWR